jgi:hypothetical protein
MAVLNFVLEYHSCIPTYSFFPQKITTAMQCGASFRQIAQALWQGSSVTYHRHRLQTAWRVAYPTERSCNQCNNSIFDAINVNIFSLGLCAVSLTYLHTAFYRAHYCQIFYIYLTWDSESTSTSIFSKLMPGNSGSTSLCFTANEVWRVDFGQLLGEPMFHSCLSKRSACERWYNMYKNIHVF